MNPADHQEMPCPACKKNHARGPYKDQPDGTSSPDRIRCSCGASLEHAVPLFATNPYGWHWHLSLPFVERESLETMRVRGGSWAAYENIALDSSTVGHRQYLKFGPGCTYAEAPEHAPDGAHGPGWKYRSIGIVDLETGLIEEEGSS